MKIEQFIIGLILFTFFVVGGSLMFSNLVTTYNVPTDVSIFNGTTNVDNNNSIFNTINELESNISEKWMEKIVGDESKGSLANAIDVLFGAAYSALTITSGSFKIMATIMNQIGMTIGLPAWIIGGLFMIVIVVIVFTIIYLIMRFKS